MPTDKDTSCVDRSRACGAEAMRKSVFGCRAAGAAYGMRVRPVARECQEGALLQRTWLVPRVALVTGVRPR
eukprot:6961689-Prymnesium_polylepis.1